MPQAKNQVGVEAVELPDGVRRPAAGSGGLAENRETIDCPNCGQNLYWHRTHTFVIKSRLFCSNCGYSRLEVNE